MNVDKLTEIIDIAESGVLTTRFALHLKELREYTQSSVTTIGSAIKMSFQSIARYEKGKTEPSISNAYKIAGYFFMTAEDFIFADDVVAVFENAVKKLCASSDGLRICKERFPHTDIEKLIKSY